MEPRQGVPDRDRRDELDDLGVGERRAQALERCALHQWVKGQQYPHELSIVTNKQLPEVPLGGKLAALGAA